MSPLAETIRIEASTRWDALDLASRLEAHHTYLVQLADERWHVCVRAGDGAGDILEDVREAARSWASQRGLESVLHVGAREIELPR